MTTTVASASLYTDLAEIARTLGHTHRLILLEHVAQGERPVERLAELSNLTIANTSQHLQHLRRAGFVETRREGKRVLYRLGNRPIEPILASLREYAETCARGTPRVGRRSKQCQRRA